MAELTEEQQRALEYQRGVRRREADARAVERSMRGDAAAAQAVRDAWAPLTKHPQDTSIP